VTRTHDHVLFFTSLGRVYRLKAYELPEGSRHSKGKALINLLPKLKEGERVQTLLPLREMGGGGSLLFATRRGLVKRTDLEQYQNIRTNGIQAILLEEGDELVNVALVADPSAQAILATASGQLVRFALTEVRPTGRATYGVIGVRVADPATDRVVTMAPVSSAYPHLLTLSSTGFGKRSKFDEYRETRRGARGVRTIRTGGRNGSVVGVLPVREDQEVLVTTQGGITIRVPVAGIRAQGRNTLGVRIIRVEPSDAVKDAVALDPPPEAEDAPPAPPPPPGAPEEELPAEEEPEADGGEDDAPPAAG
jgi:DNA gyrase subunit A